MLMAAVNAALARPRLHPLVPEVTTVPIWRDGNEVAVIEHREVSWDSDPIVGNYLIYAEPGYGSYESWFIVTADGGVMTLTEVPPGTDGVDIVIPVQEGYGIEIQSLPYVINVVWMDVLADDHPVDLPDYESDAEDDAAVYPPQSPSQNRSGEHVLIKKAPYYNPATARDKCADALIANHVFPSWSNEELNVMPPCSQTGDVMSLCSAIDNDDQPDEGVDSDSGSDGPHARPRARNAIGERCASAAQDRVDEAFDDECRRLIAQP